MGQKVKDIIEGEIKEAKYFSVIVDSTHVDQLTSIFRVVSKEGSMVERFLGFQPIESHTATSLVECVKAMVKDLGLDLLNCRGQA